MCNVNKLSKKKSVIVYKLVDIIKDKYVGIFAGLIIKTGIVSEMEFYDTDIKELGGIDNCMIGQCSGFARLKDAKIANKVLFGNFSSRGSHTIIKLKLTGIIREGTSSNISNFLSDKYIVYSGSIIESIKRIT